ncbi:MAG: hypothetical protein WKF96_17485 [Solirubrobacteraceae bacterium]
MLRPAGRVETDFLPSLDGFRFGNSWPDTPYTLPPLRGTVLDQKYGNAEKGLCGGMVYAALDYFMSGSRIPVTDKPPAGEQDPFFLYLVARLFATFSFASVSLILKLMNPAYPDADENVLNSLGLAQGRAAVMAHEEWPLIRSDIDAGRPSPMFLVTVKSLNPFDLGKCHQVLAYAYEASAHNVTLSVYDPNQHEVDSVRMSFTDGDVANRIVVMHNVAVSDDDGMQLPIYCFGRMDYSAVVPPIRGGRRLARAALASRGVVATASEPVTHTGGERVTSGRATFEVWPDCGEAEFDWSISSDRQEVEARPWPRGYYEPIFKWWIGPVRGEASPSSESWVEVPPDGEHEIVIDDAEVDFPTTPVGTSTPMLTDAVRRPVTISVLNLSGLLVLRNRPEDGNYSVALKVACAEKAEGERAFSKPSIVPVSFVGRSQSVPGLAEAIGECFHEYLNRHRAGSPTPQAVADALYAQLNRPWDPLWDPDPAMSQISDAVTAWDPALATIARLEAEVESPRDDVLARIRSGAPEKHIGIDEGPEVVDNPDVIDNPDVVVIPDDHQILDDLPSIDRPF